MPSLNTVCLTPRETLVGSRPSSHRFACGQGAQRRRCLCIFEIRPTGHTLKGCWRSVAHTYHYLYERKPRFAFTAWTPGQLPGSGLQLPPGVANPAVGAQSRWQATRTPYMGPLVRTTRAADPTLHGVQGCCSSQKFQDGQESRHIAQVEATVSRATQQVRSFMRRKAPNYSDPRRLGTCGGQAAGASGSGEAQARPRAGRGGAGPDSCTQVREQVGC